MISQTSQSIAELARHLYETALRPPLEMQFSGQFVAIEPISGRYFIGDSFDDAVNAALDECPEQLTFTLRIGHQAALHLGGMIR